MKNYQLIVVGGGPAAITLAKMLGKKMKMAVIRPEDHSLIYCAMPYAIEGIIEQEKIYKSDSLVTEAGAELIRGEVGRIDYDRKEVTLNDGRKIRYLKLVLATGATPFIPQIPGCNLSGVKGFKTEKDLKDILGFLDTGIREAVVVGAGAIGIELAQALREAKLSVDLVDMADSILPGLVDSDMATEAKGEILEKQIVLHLGAKVSRVIGEKSASGVILDNGTEIRFGSYSGKKEGLVIFATGMRPEVDLARDSQIELGRDGILVNDKMETSIPDVYAVGDCVQFVSGITNKVISGKLATNAVPMAKVLGFNLLGKERRYPGYFNGAATKVGKFFVGGTGLSEKLAVEAGYQVVLGYSELTTKFPIMPGARKLKFKLIADRRDGRLLGAQVVSGDPVASIIDLLTFAIQKKTVLEELTGLSYSSQPYQSFFPAANGVVLAAEDALRRMS